MSHPGISIVFVFRFVNVTDAAEGWVDGFKRREISSMIPSSDT